MIINKDEKPKNTIYYIAACIYEVITTVNISEVIQIFEYITYEFNLEINYQMFLLSLNFLFLIGRIEINEQGEVKCI